MNIVIFMMSTAFDTFVKPNHIRGEPIGLDLCTPHKLNVLIR